ncbi:MULTISPECIES: putative bifunctional diguanylate cyclase/phosphodiesterase [Burkholderia]|uniref:EAL domain-containing protein n=1 Tax=Burkholderia sola TaxID=2843302 RepID=A0ABV2CIF0_9BURK|nr:MULTISPECIES: EAL domain-containing protein [unclassified Burkholderia]RQV65978.1 EAL domain-containing protein [Burkholderia cenocepacia]MBP0610925.1 EAL domain-containing protein [Burkholderia sp. CpTa8-5]MBP0718100.1 EAL domain-containing protein [Burkholderia sp. AcTa6-5]CAG2351523.1 diguanylate cyclase [Burkholderia cenocepacia]CAG2351744.1 diguanylate cyclase [Burkholderia cenocepacia]
MNTEPQSSRYSLGLAAEVLASEQSVLRLITRNTPLPELLVEVCRRAEALLGDGASCTILLLDTDGVHVRVGAAPSLPAQYSAAIDGATIGPAAGSCGTAMYERRMVTVEDIETDPLWADYRAIALPLGLRACWSVPFLDDAGVVLGAFAVYHHRPCRPSDEETGLLRDIGNSVGLAVHQDRIARQLARSEEHHRLVVNSLSEGILVVSREGVVIASNPSANRMIRAKGELVGRRLSTVILRKLYEDGTPIDPHDWPSRRALETATPMLDYTVGFGLADGDIIWVRGNAVPIVRPGETQADSVLVSFNDIGPVREAQQQLRYMATRDALTGLYNRRWLGDRMRELFGVRDAAAGSARVAILFIDLVGFKKVNDTAGHDAGDALLRSVAARLAGCADGRYALTRVGGDEFVILVDDCDDPERLAGLAREVIDAIAKPFAIANNEYWLGVSIGISVAPRDGDDAVTLMRNADSAMYDAKQHGRNHFTFFTAQLNLRLQRRFAIEQSLRRALASDMLRLAYQPVVDARTGRTVGAEALLRWTSPELGPMSPAEFIPVAEDTGLIVAIGQWVLETACRQAAEWRRTIAPDLMLAVNLSPRQFHEGLVESVARCLAQTRLDPSALELEITEGVLMNDTDTVLPMLEALTDMNVRISVDDFGTGYSSLAYLKRFPLHNLKVDRSFVSGVPDHHDSVAITQAVVAMAHSLGMKVTAEGVETQAQSWFLQQIGCDMQQGYLFSRPLDAHDYARRLGAA